LQSSPTKCERGIHKKLLSPPSPSPTQKLALKAELAASSQSMKKRPASATKSHEKKITDGINKEPNGI